MDGRTGHGRKGEIARETVSRKLGGAKVVVLSMYTVSILTITEARGGSERVGLTPPREAIGCVNDISHLTNSQKTPSKRLEGGQ